MGWFDRLFDRKPVIEKSKISGPSNLENQGFNLEFTHIPSQEMVSFPAFLESFSDAYNSEWSSEQVFGRMDPIATFSNTRRAISVAWLIPAASAQEGIDNMAKIGQLMSFLYPSYRKNTGATTITMGPLMKLKFGNLIQDSDTGGPLMGYVNGFTMDPLLDEGMFMFSKDQNNTRPMRMSGEAGRTGGVLPAGLGTSHAEYIPKTVRLNCEFTVLHEHPLGWKNGQLRGGTQHGFPYATQKGEVGQIQNFAKSPSFRKDQTTSAANQDTKPAAEVNKALKK